MWCRLLSMLKFIKDFGCGATDNAGVTGLESGWAQCMNERFCSREWPSGLEVGALAGMENGCFGLVSTRKNKVVGVEGEGVSGAISGEGKTLSSCGIAVYVYSF